MDLFQYVKFINWEGRQLKEQTGTCVAVQEEQEREEGIDGACQTLVPGCCSASPFSEFTVLICQEVGDSRGSKWKFKPCIGQLFKKK